MHTKQQLDRRVGALRELCGASQATGPWETEVRGAEADALAKWVGWSTE